MYIMTGGLPKSKDSQERKLHLSEGGRETEPLEDELARTWEEIRGREGDTLSLRCLTRDGVGLDADFPPPEAGRVQM